MIIIIHTSKTMRPAVGSSKKLHAPELLDKAVDLDKYLKTLSLAQTARCMSVSDKLASKTNELIKEWNPELKNQREAIDSFLGDIYSGLQVQEWNKEDREYANKHLRILSGLYGVLKPLDGIYPYRLEMGYRLPDERYKNLYKFWSDSIYKTLNEEETIINLAAVEYSKTITDFAEEERIITPRFLSLSPKTGEPTFVVVHAKIARGAFASWMIKNQIEDKSKLNKFNDIGYSYNHELSQPNQPVYICNEFGGIGLSVRLT